MHIRLFSLLILLLISIQWIYPQSSGKGKVITLSATSFKEGFPVRNLMDENSSTYWQPVRDTQDEGVMVRFLDPTQIQEIKVITDSKAPLMLYMNGENVGAIQPNSPYYYQWNSVITLYFKIQTNDPVKVFEIIFNETNKKGELKIKPLSNVKGKVTASSYLEPEIAYSPEMVFDNRLDYSWSEGTKSNGESEFIEITFDRKTEIDSLYLANGYQAAMVHFKANTRVKEFELTADGEKIGVFTLKDMMGFQSVDLKKTYTVQKLRLTVLTVYPGTKYTDMLISEIKFGQSGRIFDLESDFLLRSSRKVVESFKGSVMEQILDQGLYFIYNPDPYNYQKITLKIRSQGDFEIWQYTGSGEYSTEEKVFDGSWNLVKQAAGRTDIKIFGKKYATSSKVNMDDPYSGPEKSEETRLFSDILTIKKAELTDIKQSGEMFDLMKDVIQKTSKPLYFISGKSVMGIFPANIEL